MIKDVLSVETESIKSLMKKEFVIVAVKKYVNKNETPY